MHVVILQGQHRKGTWLAPSSRIRSCGAGLGRALEALGAQVTFIDLGTNDSASSLLDIMDAGEPDKRPGLFVGFDGEGATLRHGERSFFAAHGVYYASFLLCHSARAAASLEGLEERRGLALVSDTREVAALERRMRTEGLAVVAPLPPGVDLEDDWPPELAWTSRDVPVLVVGDRVSHESGHGSETATARLIDRTSARLLRDDSLGVDEALEATLADLRLAPTRDQRAKLDPVLTGALARATATRQRLLIERVAATGMPIALMGEGWGALAAEHPNVTWLGACEPAAERRAFGRARLVINAGGLPGDAGIGRVLDAHAAGAAVLCEAQPPLSGSLCDGREVLALRWSELEHLGDRVLSLLADDARLAVIARAGQQAIRQDHTWARRALALLRIWKHAILATSWDRTSSGFIPVASPSPGPRTRPPPHVGLFKGQSQYGSLRTHVDQLAGALEARGTRVTILDFQQDGFMARLQDSLRATPPPGLFISFNCVGADLRVGERSLYEALGVDHLSLNVDHPIYQWERLQATDGRRLIPCFLDHSHLRYLSRRVDLDRYPTVGFLPPGASTASPSASPPAFSWGPERDIPVLFTGTFRGLPERSWPRDGSLASRIIDATVERVLGSDGVAAHEAMDAALADLGLEATRDRLAGLMGPMHTVLNHCAAVHRHAIITALCEAQVPLVVYGNGWEPLAARYPSIDWRGEGSWAETLALLPRTRIVLSTNNEFFEGAHERVFAAQAHGAAVLSETSSVYTERYRDGHDILLFRWSEVASAAARVKALLADDLRLSTIAAAGHAATCAQHTWHHRLDDLVRVWQRAGEREGTA